MARKLPPIEVNGPTPFGARIVLQGADRPRRKATGGPQFHKPDCPCRCCASRRRKAETLALTGGTGGDGLDTPQEPLNPGKVYKPKGEPIDPDNLTEIQEKDLVIVSGSHTPRGRIADWIRMKSLNPSLTNSDIARQMGIHPRTLSNIILKATKEGWLKFEDPMQSLEYQIIPKVVKNLNHFLDNQDRTVTIETAKGTLFKQFQDQKGLQENPTTVLALKIEMPENPQGSTLVTGQIIGRPREME